MVHIKSETETVIKKILPYLNRRGYDTVKDFDFETMSTLTDSYSKGFVDILVTLGKKNAAFLIEAKRISKKLTNKDRDQAISYARAKEIRVPFVVVTNGIDIVTIFEKLWDGLIGVSILPSSGILRSGSTICHRKAEYVNARI